MTELIQGPGLEKEGEWIVKNTFPDYWDDAFTAIDLWNKYKQFGLPFNPCWGNNPAWIIDAISICDSVLTKYQKDRIDGRH